VFSNELLRYIIARSAGTHQNDEVFDDARPSRKFIIGTLAAPRNKDLLFHDTEGDRASIRAQRLKVSFLVDRSKIDESSEIALKITGNVFYQVNEKVVRNLSEDNQSKEKNAENTDKKANTFKDIQIWKRLPFSETWNVKLLNNIPIASQQKHIDFSAVRRLANDDPHITENKKSPGISGKRKYLFK